MNGKVPSFSVVNVESARASDLGKIRKGERRNSVKEIIKKKRKEKRMVKENGK
jgi:hypothetical protein